MAGKKDQKKRFWSDEEKVSNRAQARVPGILAAQVARGYALNANLIHKQSATLAGVRVEPRVSARGFAFPFRSRPPVPGAVAEPRPALSGFHSGSSENTVIEYGHDHQ